MRPLKEIADEMSKNSQKAAKRYGNNPDLLVKEHPELDRRISSVYTPKEP